MKTANEIPTNETTTKYESESQSLNMDEINVSSGLVELLDLPLPNDPDENSSDSRASCSIEDIFITIQVAILVHSQNVRS